MPLIQGQSPYLVIGNRVITDVDNLIVLTGVILSAALGKSSLRVPLAGAGRAVTAGKTFKVKAIRASISSAGSILMGYCDNDCGVGTNTAPTNPVYFNCSSGTAIICGAANSQVEQAVEYSVPTGKYLFCVTDGTTLAATVTVFGYEV